ncbi:mitochondrial inner membrane protease subunit 1-like isoform X1 [Punica granatum]|uniref:Mitochondrial inner membrane protease subunit 1-like isoform X1 n=2 Tax=Punica granatum TaxID=22663 RepID=A0A6P8D2E7_PUNGR|nr:mitochondrial inner membrane protease subunit 1-like isoform X1 [Punica granatum]XP_031387806.1 mitochondrial inner membrane protease subunit 1-like isoform X1 [Punica granatum]XP_031387807.1 mitochondrial inner membrane protease subunit 1-like isoform X1 [Punica granatum]XP_031387808.1 mitochondrial inner membrane protease subunit 1-like isoform X1 [Punica granatum]XP_031387809.1 mitochondrial inner membrane protease subunit 1-like isoform X1 [Punica granatum]XP_031387810.1 mitochondrial i
MALRNIGLWAVEGFELAFSLAKFCCCIHVTGSYVMFPALAMGPSMLPTIDLNGNVIIVERASVWLQKVSRGDMVVLTSPEDPNKQVIKRIVGMEGESVTYLIKPGESDECQTIVVPKGRVWVQGDNIHDSRDSRVFGAIPYGLVHGKLFWRVWPASRFGSMCNV